MIHGLDIAHFAKRDNKTSDPDWSQDPSVPFVSQVDIENFQSKGSNDSCRQLVAVAGEELKVELTRDAWIALEIKYMWEDEFEAVMQTLMLRLLVRPMSEQRVLQAKAVVTMISFPAAFPK